MDYIQVIPILGERFSWLWLKSFDPLEFPEMVFAPSKDIQDGLLSSKKEVSPRLWLFLTFSLTHKQI